MKIFKAIKSTKENTDDAIKNNIINDDLVISETRLEKFNRIKEKIKEFCKTDRYMKENLQIQIQDNINHIMLYQGPKSNVLGRIFYNGRYNIQRETLKKKLMPFIDKLR